MLNLTAPSEFVDVLANPGIGFHIYPPLSHIRRHSYSYINHNTVLMHTCVLDVFSYLGEGGEEEEEEENKKSLMIISGTESPIQHTGLHLTE